jgi:hypothetical protein
VKNPTISELSTLATTLTRCFGRAWIAGGCLRDIIHNKPVKDIDVFLPDYPTYAQREKLYEALTGYPPISVKGPGRLPYDTPALPGLWNNFEHEVDYDAEQILNVYSGGPTWHGLSLQLIQVFDEDVTPLSIVRKFDIDLCKIYLHGARVVGLPEFHRDSTERRITVHQDLARTEDHLDRLVEKYPAREGWRVRKVGEGAILKITALKGVLNRGKASLGNLVIPRAEPTDTPRAKSPPPFRTCREWLAIIRLKRGQDRLDEWVEYAEGSYTWDFCSSVIPVPVGEAP